MKNTTVPEAFTRNESEDWNKHKVDFGELPSYTGNGGLASPMEFVKGFGPAWFRDPLKNDNTITI